MRTIPALLGFITVVSIISCTACSRSNLSDRDSRREQIRDSAELKRQELKKVVGDYYGHMTQENGVRQAVRIHLEIKNIPQEETGQVDPVMVPVLSGYLRFSFGGTVEESEYIGFGVDKAEYDATRAKLDLVVSNASYKRVVLSLSHGNGTLRGEWTAPEVAASGQILASTINPPPATWGREIRGEYGGVLLRDQSGHQQLGHLTVRTNYQPPEGLKVNATLRLIFGEWESSEYLTYKFDQVDFNPISGQFVLKSQDTDVIFTGYFSEGKVAGSWFSSYTGKLGLARFDKQIPPTVPNPNLYDSLKGTYQGSLTNTNPQSNLPERVQVSFVTGQDLSKPNGINISGGLRLYMGEFDSLEYVELPLKSIEFNFFTGTLVAKTGGDYHLTLKADVTSGEIYGTLHEDSLGQTGSFTVEKLEAE